MSLYINTTVLLKSGIQIIPEISLDKSEPRVKIEKELRAKFKV